MKKIILFILLFMPIAVFSQTHKYYCEVTGTEKALINGMKVIFDFGSNPTYNLWGDLNNKLKFVDDNGKEINFNTMVDAANYMEDKGGQLHKSVDAHNLPNQKSCSSGT